MNNKIVRSVNDTEPEMKIKTLSTGNTCTSWTYIKSYVSIKRPYRIFNLKRSILRLFDFLVERCEFQHIIGKIFLINL